MIKRIILDIDNTILDSFNDSLKTYQTFMKNTNTLIDTTKLYKIIGEYETMGGNYEIENISEYIAKNLNINFSSSNFEEILNIYSNEATLLEPDIESTFKILSNKYELIALSNWYSTCQRKRLDKVGLGKYFKEIYGIDNSAVKPNIKAFELAKGNHQYNECLMVGDNITNDIIVPRKLGMKTLLYTKDKQKKYEKIISLKEILEVVENEML